MAETRFVYLYTALMHPLAGSSGEISLHDARKDALSKLRKMLERNLDPAMKYEEESTQERLEQIHRYMIQRHQEVQDFVKHNAGADFFSCEVRNLQEQIDNLISMRLAITDLRGSLPRGKAFLTALEAFYTDYAFVMKLHPDMEACGIKELKNLNRLRAMEWDLRYYYFTGTILEHKEDESFNQDEVHSDAVRRARIEMAMCALKGDLVKAPEITPTLAMELWNTLDDDLKWIVDWTVIPPLGLQSLAQILKLIGAEMERVTESISTLSDIAFDLRRFRIYDPVDPHADPAVTSEDDTCPVCCVEYANDDSTAAELEEAPLEPAVKLRGCGHVIGLRCLQEWIYQRAQNCTCPLCRAPFFDRENRSTVYGAVMKVMLRGLLHIHVDKGSIRLFKAAMPGVIDFFRKPFLRAQMRNPNLPALIAQHADYLSVLMEIGDGSEFVMENLMFQDSTEYGGPVPHRTDYF